MKLLCRITKRPTPGSRSLQASVGTYERHCFLQTGTASWQGKSKGISPLFALDQMLCSVHNLHNQTQLSWKSEEGGRVAPAAWQ